jgi:hypothetical protein
MSFTNIESKWMRETKKNDGEKLIPILLGINKNTQVEVGKMLIDQLSNKFRMNYFEVQLKSK